MGLVDRIPFLLYLMGGGPTMWVFGYLFVYAGGLLWDLVTSGRLSHQDVAKTKLLLLVMLFVWCAAAVIQMLYGLSGLLYLRNGHVIVDSSGLEARDWLGRTRRVAWEEVEGMRLTRIVRRKPPFVVVVVTRKGNRNLRISPYLKDHSVLVSELLRRSGVVEKTRSWLTVTYARPTQAGTAGH